MLNIIAPGVASAIAMFFAGKYTAEQPTKIESIPITKSIEEIIVPNTFRQETVTIPLRYIQYPHFKILYSTYHKSPLAVHQIITKDLVTGDADRAKFFFPEEHIKDELFQVDQSYFAQTEAYKRFNVNRGHMAAAGNYSSSPSQKFYTFTFSNVIPQDGHNNGGIWNSFQRYARQLAESNKCDSVEIISGPIYPKNSPFNGQQDKKIYSSKLIVLKENGILIPQKLYKIIKCNTKRQSYLDSFQFLNSKTSDNGKSLETFKVPLKSVENQTGLKFNFPDMKSISQLQEKILKITKNDLDTQFYTKLMLGSRSISDINGGLSRAKEQEIKINLQLMTNMIRGFLPKELQSIEKEQLLSCQKLKKVLSLNKKLYYLYHLQKTKDLRLQKMNNIMHQCFTQSQQNKQQNLILQTLRKDNKKTIQELLAQ